MIVDVHAHVTAPDGLYVYKAGLLSHRGSHGRGSSGVDDEDIVKALNTPVFGGNLVSPPRGEVVPVASTLF